MSRNTYASLVRIKDSPACGNVFLGDRRADHVANPHIRSKHIVAEGSYCVKLPGDVIFRENARKWYTA